MMLSKFVLEEFFHENLPQELSQPLNVEVLLLLVEESLKMKEHVPIRFYWLWLCRYFFFVFDKITQKPTFSLISDAGAVYHFFTRKTARQKYFFSNSFPQKSGFGFEPKNPPWVHFSNELKKFIQCDYVKFSGISSKEKAKELNKFIFIETQTFHKAVYHFTWRSLRSNSQTNYFQ